MWLRVRTKSADNFRRNSFACGNLSVRAPCFLSPFIGRHPGKQGRLDRPYSGTVPFQSPKSASCKTSFSQWFCEKLNILRSCALSTGKYFSTFREIVAAFILRIRQSKKGWLLVYEDDTLAVSKRYIFHIPMIRRSLKPYSAPLHFCLHTQSLFLQHMLMLFCCLRMDLSSNF
jgi:hypothetical protein